MRRGPRSCKRGDPVIDCLRHLRVLTWLKGSFDRSSSYMTGDCDSRPYQSGEAADSDDKQNPHTGHRT